MLQVRHSFFVFTTLVLVWGIPCRAQEEKQSTRDKPGAATKQSTRSKSNAKKSKPGEEGKSGEETDAPVEATPGIQLFAPRKMEMQFGMRFFSNDNYCTALHATIPFPMNWPEQTVRVVSDQIPGNAVWAWRDLPAGAKQNALARQLVMDIAALTPNNQLELLVNVEVEKHFINPPPDTSVFSIPKNVPTDMNMFLKSSPYIEIELGEIKRVAKQIAADNPSNAWGQVEKIYDWVRDNIKYRHGKLRQIRDALKDKEGDCEEMTGIFVALCRASKIPARCVWIPQHCYPEFYLEDPQGEGHWFPCQVAGERQFGQMHDYRPILQKGDRFKVPEDTVVQRYVAQTFSCKSRASRPGLAPSVEEVMDLGPLKAEMEALRLQSEPQP
jgi:hypothetical protein